LTFTGLFEVFQIVRLGVGNGIVGYWNNGRLRKSSLSGLRSRFGGVGWLRRQKKILVRSITSLCHHTIDPL
jgi:hypothetical protein